MISIDTNILARFLLDDIPDHSDRCRKLFQRAARREIELFVPATAIVELMWLLIRQKQFPKSVVIENLVDLLRIQSVIVENESAMMSALRAYRDISGLSFADCYHLALTADLGMTQIYTFDKKMDRFPGVKRIEPGAE